MAGARDPSEGAAAPEGALAPQQRLFPSSGETEPLVLSRGDLFLVVDRRGDVAPAGARDLGLFHQDTRHLSRYQLWIAGGPATVLSAETAGAALSQIDLTLTDRDYGGFFADPRNFLHVRRRQALGDAECVERIALTNHLSRAITVEIAVHVEADFADIFEVRGARRDRHGERLEPAVGEDSLLLAYRGVDGSCYRTRVQVSPPPTRMAADGPRWRLPLQAGESAVLEVVVAAGRDDAPAPAWVPFDVRLGRAREEHQAFVAGCTRLLCDDPRFQHALERSLGDLDSLRIAIGGNRIVGAGIPWFSAPFGRDAILTALECLPVAPVLAREALRFLAAWQGQRDDPFREEEPGRILHELRRGEMTRAGESPHSPYYGTIDATPLWLLLLHETWRWTGDDALVDELMPAARRALAWIERRLEAGGGLLRYQRAHQRGLENQGWKDSRDGVSYPGGRIAEPPIALVEVQGYAAAALDAMGHLLRRRGEARAGSRLHLLSAALRRRLADRFRLEASGYYALAIDGQDQVVPTITSNPGHLLFCRAVPPAEAEAIAATLMDEALFSGWGIRTLARGQAVYNPLSYHNGSVWPHDNAVIALGLALFDKPDAVLALLEGLHAASLHFRDGRLPELFCGMARRPGDFLVKYPVACSPQAWASGAFFLLLRAALGLHPDAPAGRLTIRNPRLPAFLSRLDLEGLQVGRSRVHLHFARHGPRTHADLVDITGDPGLKVLIEIG